MPRPSPRRPRAAPRAAAAETSPADASAAEPPRAASSRRSVSRRSAIFAPEYQAMLTALRTARREAGLTLRDAAEALGRPISFVSKCETGERRIDPIDLWRFAGLYGRPVTDFLPPSSPPAARLNRASAAERGVERGVARDARGGRPRGRADP